MQGVSSLSIFASCDCPFGTQHKMSINSHELFCPPLDPASVMEEATVFSKIDVLQEHLRETQFTYVNSSECLELKLFGDLITFNKNVFSRTVCF